MNTYQQMAEVRYYELAREYLLRFEGVTDQIIDRQLNEWRYRRPTTYLELFRAYLEHAVNRRNMPQAIGNIQNLAPVLFDFDPESVLETYKSWGSLFDAIESSGLVPPGRMRKDKAVGYWVVFCKAILTSAEFLSTYGSLIAYEEFIDSYTKDESSRLALIDIIASNVHGFGFALACDLLKETGHPEYVKPDVHVCDISYGLGISASPEPRQVFQDVIAYAHRIDKVPYEIDKLFWLVGSGNFYLSDLKVNSSRQEFLSTVRQKIAGKKDLLDSLLDEAFRNGEARIIRNGIAFIIRPARA